MTYFSGSTLGFIPSEWKTDGTYSDGSWPSDAVQLTDDESNTYWKATPPEGKVLSADSGGRPVWADKPPLSHDEEVYQAESKKSALIADVSKEISILSDAVDLGMATIKETELYNDLRRYRVNLSRVDTSTAPNITWPVKP